MEQTNRFPEIRLSSGERTFYNGLASAALRKAVAEYTKFKGYVDTKNWGYVRRRKQMSIYRRLQPHDDPRTSVMVGTGQIPGTLEEVMDGLYCDTTQDLRAVKTLLDYKLKDGAVFNVTERREPSAPFRFAGIKWMAGKAPWGVTSNRDILSYERMGTIVDKHGTEVAYHVVQSIDRVECPANISKGMKREQASVCYLYRRDKKGAVQCFVYGEVYDVSPLTQRVAEYVIAGVWLNVVKSVKCAQAKKFSAMIAQSGHRSVPASNTCHVCNRGQSFMGSSHIKCAGCSENTCKSCSHEHTIFKIDSRTGSPEDARFCKHCTSRVRGVASPQTPLHRDRWDSAPASLNYGGTTPVEFPTPQLRKMSLKIKYDLLEPSFHNTSQSLGTQFSSSFDESMFNAHSIGSSSASSSAHNPLADSHLSVWSANSHSSDSTNSSFDSDRAPIHQKKSDFDDLEMRRTEGLGEFDLDMDMLPITDASDSELDADLRPTESLGMFDLDLDLTVDPNLPARGAANGSHRNQLDRTHHELVFASSRWRVGREKERFLSDLYAN